MLHRSAACSPVALVGEKSKFSATDTDIRIFGSFVDTRKTLFVCEREDFK